jgi:hypothetical protein
MAALQENLEWKARWEERGQAVCRVLGETCPPGSVVPFSWKEYILPGACGLKFEPTASRKSYLYMTLGLTQPLRATDPAFPWEFSVRADKDAEWPMDLLYQLLTQWLCEKGKMGFGYHLPLVFFTDRGGKLWAGLTDELADLNIVGSIRGLYLWTDDARLRFRVSSGEFGLLTVLAITEDEDRLAREATPAHLLLLLRRKGVSQVCNPYRSSVLEIPSALKDWTAIKGMPHDEALNELQKPA